MADNRTQFTFYESFFKAISRIKKAADRALAYDAICSYALYGTEPDLDKLPDAAAIAFELSKPNLDASRKKAKNGKKGGANGKQTESKQEANGKQTESKKEKEKENEKEKEYECTPLTPLDNFSSELKAAVQDWLAYKKERREPYKPTGLKNLISQIENSAKKYGDQAVVDVIRSSMSSNYQGIVFDRLKKGGVSNDGNGAGDGATPKTKLYGNYV